MNKINLVRKYAERNSAESDSSSSPFSPNPNFTFLPQSTFTNFFSCQTIVRQNYFATNVWLNHSSEEWGTREAINQKVWFSFNQDWFRLSPRLSLTMQVPSSDSLHWRLATSIQDRQYCFKTNVFDSRGNVIATSNPPFNNTETLSKIRSAVVSASAFISSSTIKQLLLLFCWI